MIPSNLPDSQYRYGEKWKPLPRDGYYLSSHGRIWKSTTAGGGARLIKPRIRPCSADATNLISYVVLGDSDVYQSPLGRTVLLFFGPPMPDDGMYLCHHTDGNPANNRLENLEWKKLENLTNRGHGGRPRKTKEIEP
jgi:hypothetical protein